ncbi:acyl-activating enzyme [Gonapodya prolifera JEL478]|uniref:Acetyl-coenzyme A synthetase n=1 Tax=Gonapodya prolifera (strain JEL478) TaxID=1344416 RepID=A0A138ZZN3_GONPJ|nr:acyl-activating enzyme [Gonapodya prolifera JEL478]|eukprot:KXS09972.1 acyl-activating enzyme [Gonapodya prolifera JEL478]
MNPSFTANTALRALVASSASLPHHLRRGALALSVSAQTKLATTASRPFHIQTHRLNPSASIPASQAQAAQAAELDSDFLEPVHHDLDPVFKPPERLFAGDVPVPHIKSREEYVKLYQESIKAPSVFWSKMASELLEWERPPKFAAQGGYEDGDFSWFDGGLINACVNAVDRHAAATPDKTAIIWESDEPGEHEHISYRRLLIEVSKLANVFKSHGLRKGDHVAIYMPMVPEALYAMLACARLGLVHCVVFAGFSADAVRDRINDCGAKLVITADQGKRGGKVINLKRTVDQALLETPTIEKCLVFRRTGEFNIPFHKGRDLWYHEEVEKARPVCPPEPMHPEDPLFILYTSGSTGKPKGLIHSTGGYMLQTASSFKYIFDYHPSDIYGCMADVGWITGHSYICYGPLTMGATTVVFESIPTYPDAGRFWDCVQTHKITQLYTAPTAIRTLKKFGDEFVTKHDLSSLRVLGSVGEPINPEAWQWYHQVPGRSQCAIVDTYWQTETGSIIMTPLPGAIATKPGSCTVPFFGIEPVIIDATTGAEIKGNDVTGVLALRMHPGGWPSMARTILGDHKRFLDTYFNVYKGYYFTGDGAHRDKDGYYWVRGRVDDVINVSGHRISTSEVESAMIGHPAVAESAVVGIPDDVTGQALAVFVVLKPEFDVPLAPSPEATHHHHIKVDDVKKSMIQHIRQAVGPFAAPKMLFLVPDLPKTRSGKIMRRILRKVGGGEVKSEEQIKELGDLSTLADPGLIPQLVEIVHAKAK